MPLLPAVAVINVSKPLSMQHGTIRDDYGFRLIDLSQEFLAGADVLVYQPRRCVPKRDEQVTP